MKANELMIGDWVYLDDIAPKRISLGDLIEISRGMQSNPIHINEDFLSANNIEYEFYDCYHFHFKHKCVDLHLSGYFYVHELQHALRLCGLNELADNFKLKDE